MPLYKAPLDDIRFLLNEVLNLSGVADLPKPERVDIILEAAAKMSERVLFPLNALGDNEGCSFEDGKVKTPDGFSFAYRAFREGGWTGMSCKKDCGGRGLPLLLNFIIYELISSANISFSLYPILSRAAYRTIEKHASEELKKIYLPKLVAGIWTGTMCLSEPQSGSDLGLILTMATLQGDGAYKINGKKIFISSGEHDLSDNIVHMVLARTPDGLPGIRGLSLFLVPKFLPDTGVRNQVFCTHLEEKMGLHASATCRMNFDGATGWLVGTPGKGASAMFTMMNEARMTVGVQGLGIAEVAYQNAAAYAKDRLQMRSLRGAKFPNKIADPIIVHPDIRQKLLTMRSLIQGCRAMVLWIARGFDHALKHPDEKKRGEAADLVALMIPIIKAFATDMGFEAANAAVQIYGGHGYIRDNGVEQYVRDARITQIYEGTNGIQALDLVMRKMPEDYGRLLRSFFLPVTQFLSDEKDNKALAPYRPAFLSAFNKLQMASLYIMTRSATNPDEAGTGAYDYLRIFAYVTMGYMWLKMAKAAAVALPTAGARAPFYDAKLKTANFYFSRILPQVQSHYRALLSGSEPIMDFPADAF